MKFFKHFTDSHEGRSMQSLMNEWGLEGYAAYFILMELCGKKLEKAKDEPLTDDHLRFTFNERLLREKLRMRSTKVELFLNSCSTLVLLQFTKVKDEFNFYVPKLAECMDRDSKRARTDRAPTAPKKKKEIKKKIKSIYAHEFERLSKKFKTLFPTTTTGNAEPRFNNQITSDQALKDLELSMDHYRQVLNASEWREPKTTFENYLGTQKSGFFWRQFIEPPILAKITGADLSHIEWSGT